MPVQDQQIEQIQIQKQEREDEGEGGGEEEEDCDTKSEEKMETESKNDISVPQFQSKFSQQITNNLISQKIRQNTKENKEEIMKYSQSQIKPNGEEIEFKKQDNLSDLTYQQSLNFQNSSYQDQFSNLIRFDTYQKTSQLHSPEFKEKLIQMTSSTFKLNKVKQKLSKPNKSTLKQKKNLNVWVSDQQVEESLKILNEKQFSQSIEDKFFKTKILQSKDSLENRELKRKIEKQIDDSLDFFKFFKEILFLKKAALILLSKEQLAAIQLVGLDIGDIEPKSHKVESDLQGKNQCTNYIKEQFEIMQSSELQSQYIKIFLKQCQNKISIDPIDKRILSSLIINKDN
ncbi:hypothetical protein ABPG73_012849 [Tetrahymena malaccensis]